MWKMFLRAAPLVSALSLAACAGDPLPPSHSPADPANPHASEAPFDAPLTAAPSTTGVAPPSAEMHDHSAHASADAGVTYTCPMHPEVQSSTPGSCPKCGMTLVPKKP